jgi:benzoyl-CoA reductase subunit B
MEAIADCYFMRRVPPAWFRPGKERLDFLITLAKDFNVDGVIWNYLFNCRPLSQPSHLLKQFVEKGTNIPVLSLEFDFVDSRFYSAAVLKTRVETFAQMLRARKSLPYYLIAK